MGNKLKAPSPKPKEAPSSKDQRSARRCFQPQPGGLPDISRGLRSAATTPPVAGQTNLPHPGGVPEIRGVEAAAWDWRTVLAPLLGAGRLRRHSGGVAGAQPPANVWQPSGLARSARLQVERHTLERPQCSVGFGDVGELGRRRDNGETLNTNPRPAAQRLPGNQRSVRAVPPLHAAELSQRDNRYRF